MPDMLDSYVTERESSHSKVHSWRPVGRVSVLLGSALVRYQSMDPYYVVIVKVKESDPAGAHLTLESSAFSVELI